jgi:beta-glucosidase
VRNAGGRAGAEVVQLYIRDALAPVARPVKELRGFARVALEPGEAKRVRFRLSAAQTAFWGRDSAGRSVWRIEPGRIELMIGASSDAIRARAAFSITTRGFASAPAAAVLTETSIAPA